MNFSDNEINCKLAQDLIKSQFPQFAKLPIVAMISAAEDHKLFRLGENMIIRMPKFDWAADSIKNEIFFSTELAKQIKTSISYPMHIGLPSKIYPWHWVITPWYDGAAAQFEKNNEYANIAIELSNFLNQMHEANIINSRESKRNISLNELQDQFYESINQLEQEANRFIIKDIWQEITNEKSPSNIKFLIHGDLLPSNILIKDNRLTAIIDFSDIGLGDPICDLIIAWSIFNKESRLAFKNNLKYIDESTWRRGKAWSLAKAIIMLAYFQDKSLKISLLARRIRDNILKDDL